MLFRIAVEFDSLARAGDDDDVVGVHRSDGLVNLVNDMDQLVDMRVRRVIAERLVDQVVHRNRFIVPVPLREGLPQPRQPLLAGLVAVEPVLPGPAGRVVHALAARHAVHVEDDIQPLPARELDGPVQPSDAVLLELERLRVVLDQRVVERDPHHVHPETPHHGEVPLGDVVFPVQLHQAVPLRLAEPLLQDRLKLVLVANAVQVEHPHLQQQPVAEIAALEIDLPTPRVHDPGAVCAQERSSLFRWRKCDLRRGGFFGRGNDFTEFFGSGCHLFLPLFGLLHGAGLDERSGHCRGGDHQEHPAPESCERTHGRQFFQTLEKRKTFFPRLGKRKRHFLRFLEEDTCKWSGKIGLTPCPRGSALPAAAAPDGPSRRRPAPRRGPPPRSAPSGRGPRPGFAGRPR